MRWMFQALFRCGGQGDRCVDASMLADADLYESCDAENTKSLGCCALDGELWR